MGTTLRTSAFRAFIAKIDAGGKLLWLAHGDKGNFQPEAYSNAMPGPFETVLVGGHNALAAYSAKGRLIRGFATGYSSEVLGVLSNGSFLVNQRDGYHIVAYGPTGRERWSANTGIPNKFGVVPHIESQQVAVGNQGLFSDELMFTGIDPRGNLAWQASISGYHDDYRTDENLNSALRANDGTIRVVMNVGFPFGNSSAGVAVAAFAFESQQLLPRKPFLTFSPTAELFE